MEFLTRVQEFFQEVPAEFRRVTWPSREEVRTPRWWSWSWCVVLALYLGGVDVGLSKVCGGRILK